MAEADNRERTVRLATRRRLTATNEETHPVESTVHCPVQQAAVAVSACRTCPRFVKESAAGAQDLVECLVPVAARPSGALAGELLSPEVTCLDCELEASRAVELMEVAGVTSAPVLDDNSVLVGVVSTSALARIRSQAAREGFGPGDAPLEVEDAMSTEVVTLSQRASIGEAARVMAARNVDRIPIVTDDGHLVGVLSAMDLVKWLASWSP